MYLDASHVDDDGFEYQVPKTRQQMKIETIDRQVDRLLTERARLESIGEDPFEDGAVIVFDKVFGNGRTYSYAAIRAEGMWYTTGPRAPKAYTWFDLINWIGVDTIIYAVTEMEELDAGH